MYKALVITDEAGARGFQLAGIDVLVADVKTIEEVFATAMQREHVALIIIDEGLLSGLSMTTQNSIFTSTFPMIVPIPSAIKKPGSDEKRESYIDAMIRRSVGRQLNIKL